MNNRIFCAGCKAELTPADCDAKACTQCGTKVPRNVVKTIRTNYKNN
jgi:hypothetical protein